MSTSLNVLRDAGMTSSKVAPGPSPSRDAPVSSPTLSRDRDGDGRAAVVKKRVVFRYRSSVCWATWVMTSQRGVANVRNVRSESITLENQHQTHTHTHAHIIETFRKSL